MKSMREDGENRTCKNGMRHARALIDAVGAHFLTYLGFVHRRYIISNFSMDLIWTLLVKTIFAFQ